MEVKTKKYAVFFLVAVKYSGSRGAGRYLPIE